MPFTFNLTVQLGLELKACKEKSQQMRQHLDRRERCVRNSNIDLNPYDRVPVFNVIMCSYCCRETCC
jgi:hypothetical protein